MKNIKLIVCDIDNTVIPAGEKAISRRLKRDFDLAEKNGIHVMINTGRHYTFLQPTLFEDLSMEVIGTINGACLTDRNGKVLFKHGMKESDMNFITDYCLENGIGLGYKFEDRIVTYANHDRFMAGYLGNDDADKASLILNDTAMRTHHLEAGTPLGTFIICSKEEAEPMQEKMPDFSFAWSYRNGFDVFETSLNKSTCVEPVLKMYGIGWENVIAFGDAGNDQAFVEKAGIGVAMGNAKDSLKEHADYVAPDTKEDGVAVMLEKLGIVEVSE